MAKSKPKGREILFPICLDITVMRDIKMYMLCNHLNMQWCIHPECDAIDVSGIAPDMSMHQKGRN